MPSYLFEGWTLVAISCFAIVCFLLGLLIDQFLHDEGFGPIGNAVVIGAGFVTGVQGGAMLGFIGGTDMILTAAAGLVGAALALTILSGLKAGLNRLV